MIGSHRQRWSVHIVYDPYQVAMYCGGIMTMIDRLIDINVQSQRYAVRLANSHNQI